MHQPENTLLSLSAFERKFNIFTTLKIHYRLNCVSDAEVFTGGGARYAASA